jgi:hypothetical protein
MGNYGVIRSTRGDHDEALSVLRTAVNMSTEFAGTASPVAVQNRLFLAEALDAAGETVAALALLRENLALATRQFGEGHALPLRIRLLQARIAVRTGDVHVGESELTALVEQFRKQGKAGQLPLAQALVLRADWLMKEGRRSEAVAPLTEALQVRQTLLWERSPDIEEARAKLAAARE